MPSTASGARRAGRTCPPRAAGSPPRTGCPGPGGAAAGMPPERRRTPGQARPGPGAGRCLRRGGRSPRRSLSRHGARSGQEISLPDCPCRRGRPPRPRCRMPSAPPWPGCCQRAPARRAGCMPPPRSHNARSDSGRRWRDAGPAPPPSPTGSGAASRPPGPGIPRGRGPAGRSRPRTPVRMQGKPPGPGRPPRGGTVSVRKTRPHGAATSRGAASGHAAGIGRLRPGSLSSGACTRRPSTGSMWTGRVDWSVPRTARRRERVEGKRLGWGTRIRT